MKGLKRFFCVLFLSLAFLCNVNAKTDLNVESSKSDVKPGEKFSISVIINSDENIYTFASKLNYDREVFELINENNFNDILGWENLRFNKSNNRFVLINNSGFTNGKVIELNFKVKNKPKYGQTAITFTNTVCSNGKKDIIFNENRTIVEVIGKKANNSIRNINSVIEDEKVLNYFPFLILGIVLIGVLIFVCIYDAKIKYLEDSFLKIIYSIVIFILIGILVSIVIFIVLNRKKDINKDKQVNIQDTIMIMEYYIELKPASVSDIYYDYNNDGKITITDIASSIKKVNNLSYSFSNLKSNKTKSFKNDTINITFTSEISNNEKIKYVLIGLKKYEVNNISSNEYSFSYKLPNKSGNKHIKIRKLILESGKKIKVNEELTVNVSNEQSKVKSVNYDINTNNLEVILDNSDSLLESAILTIKQNDEEIINEMFDLSKTNFKLKDLNGKYQVIITGLYNQNDSLEPVVLYDNEIEIISDYSFKYSNLSYNKDEELLTFKSSNSSNYYIEKIIINDKEYKVNNNGNNYSVNLKYDENVSVFNITKFILYNGASFDVKESVSSIKIGISLDDFKYESTASNKLIGTYKLSDPKNEISKILLTLKNSKGTIIKKLTVDKDKESFEFSNIPFSNNTYKIIIDAKLKNGKSKRINKYIVKTSPMVNIKGSVSKKYVNKESDFYITYKITDNINENPTSIKINGNIYSLERVNSETYKVKLKSTNFSGTPVYKVSSVFYKDLEVECDESSKIEVLKDTPTIIDIKTDDNYNKGMIKYTFYVDDRDSAFIKGYAYISNREDDKKEIHSGKNEIVFDNVPINTSLYFLVDIEYDTDNELKNENYYKTNALIMPFFLFDNLDIEVSDVKFYKDEKENLYFSKNDEITVKFRKNDSLPYNITKIKINGNFYDVTLEKDNYYKVVLPGFKTTGLKELSFEEAILDSGKSIKIDDNKVEVQVLKEAPFITNFKFENNEEEGIISFNLDNSTTSLIEARLRVYVKKGKNKTIDIYNTSQLTDGPNTFKFELQNYDTYYVTIESDYDLDNNAFDNVNYYENKKLYEGIKKIDISLYKELIINNYTLYRETNGYVNKVIQVDLKDLENNKDKYLLKLETNLASAFYSRIDSYSTKNNILSFKLVKNDYLENADRIDFDNINVEYGYIDGDKVYSSNIKDIADIVKENKNAHIYLLRDWDLSELSNDYIIKDAFSGTFDGRGHTLYNLGKPLFKETENAVIKNLKINKTKLIDMYYNVIESSSKTTYKNVLITNTKGKYENYNGMPPKGLNKMIKSKLKNAFDIINNRIEFINSKIHINII